MGGATALALLLISCSRSPTTAPGSSGPLMISRLQIVAPAEIAPGESVQLTLNAIKSDGSVENVTSQAVWLPTASSILQISSSGVATGLSRGEVIVSGRYSGRDAAARIFVLPKGTFRLGGTIKENGFGIENVRLTVLSGVEESLTATSDSSGNYILYGVSGTVRIQVKKEGYLTGLHEITVTAHRTADFDIVPERMRTDYRGTYTLTISAASRCRSGPLPEDATRRVYTANVAQEGARLTVTLSDADFVLNNGHGNGFVGFVDITGGITFTISDAYYYYYFTTGYFDIAERFGNVVLLVMGTATVKGTPALISGMMNGDILLSSNLTPPFRSMSARCSADTHGFEMIRR
jgi:hypothetical protein